ncbi:hypothetical protein L195_g045138 [Trifolium pratense]|uniref:Uncharacterized protein n=1 Tax=Trifolium pratense TaxID=57577 RepID=A0A2K3ME03_TRIPR|nr:hypothetical protein L195_g045138 [Trifolium pratense]
MFIFSETFLYHRCQPFSTCDGAVVGEGSATLVVWLRQSRCRSMGDLEERPMAMDIIGAAVMEGGFANEFKFKPFSFFFQICSN